MDHAGLLADLEQALSTHDEPRVDELTEAAVADVLGSDDGFPSDVADTLLGMLLHGRNFAGVIRVGDALLQTGTDGHRVRRYYALALAEQGFLTAAETMADRLKVDAETGEQRADAQDLLGSIYERMYVSAAGAATNARKETLLEQALQGYYPTYQMAPQERSAQGIEVVALLRRAKQDGVSLGGFGDPERIAEKVAQAVSQPTAPASLATAIKAAVARDENEAALRYANSFIGDPATGAYEISGLLWDLEYLWQLDESSDLGAPLLGLLKTGLLERPDFSHVEFTPAQAQAAVDGLEKVFGKDGVVTLKWYKNGLECARSVAKIEDRGGNPRGTGFLVPGGSLHPSLEGVTVMITNNHVIATDPDPRIGQLTPNASVVEFQALDEEGVSGEVALTRMIFESPVSELDASVLEVDSAPEGIAAYRLADGDPELGGTPKVYVIGHPRGGTLSYSIDDNVLIDFDDRVLHYRSPTEPGSSGSPLFDRNWDLLGLHSRGNDNIPKLHGQDGTYATNVGFRITALKAAMADALT